MSSLDFPLNPIDSQEYSLNGVTYYYNAALGAWLTKLSSAPLPTAFNRQVLFNDAGLSNGSYGLVFDKSANTLFANTINVSSNMRVSGNLYIGSNTVTITDTAVMARSLFVLNEAGHMTSVPSGSTSNLAFDTANAAYAAANNVGPQIAPAFNTANAAFGKANTALQNASGTFSGDLTITGNVTSSGRTISSLIAFNTNTSSPASDAAIYRPADGTLAFVSNAVERMRITSSGHIGIGSSNPPRKLVVSNNAFEGVEIGPGNLNGDASGAVSTIYYNRTSSAYVNNIQDAAQHVWNLSGTERMRINNSGHVTMPYLPAFYARGSGSQSWSGAMTETKLNFSSGSQFVTSNKSAGWSSVNSRFTIPVTGTYEFVLSFATEAGASTGPAAIIYKNGSAITEVCIGYFSTTYCQCTGNIFLDLVANDYIEYYISNYNSTSFTLDRARCKFSGRLIG